MTTPLSVPDEPQYPDPALLASIEHQAEKLGYLVAQVEQLFAKRANEARHIALFQHGVENLEIQKKWLNGDINIEEAGEMLAQLAERTSALTDEVREIYTINYNRLNELVLSRIEKGRSSASDLDNFLNEVLNPEREQ